MIRLDWNRYVRVLTAHAVHACLLLLPSLLRSLVSGPVIVRDSALMVFGLSIVLAGIIEGAAVVAPGQPSPIPTRDSCAMRVAAFVGMALLMVFWSAQLEHFRTGSQVPGVAPIGAVMLTCGITLRFLAIRALGSRFNSDVYIEESVIDSGIYAWLRHPSEWGLLLIVAGAPLLINAVVTAAAAAILLLPVSLWRMQRENRALALVNIGPSVQKH